MKKKSFYLLAALTVLACCFSCKSSISSGEMKNAINDSNERCPIDYKGVGEITHFDCDIEGKTVKIDFKLNNDYMSVERLETLNENAVVIAGVDVVNQSQGSVDWTESGYNVELSIYDGAEGNEASKKWSHTYDSDFLVSTNKDFDYQMGFSGGTMAQLIAFDYANNVLSKELPKETRGPWRIERISTVYDYIDIYYTCTEEGATLNIFMVEGEDDQKLLGGGENQELTRMEMQRAFRNGKTVFVGGEPLFGLDFLYHCDIPARYHFDPFCTITFRDK